MMPTTTTSRVVHTVAIVTAAIALIPLFAGAQGIKTSASQSLRVTRAQYDYGDAPRAVFPTLHSQDGIRHPSPHIVMFGTSVTREGDAKTRPITTADDMDQDDGSPRQGINNSVRAWVSAERVNQAAYINVAVNRDNNSRIDSQEWRVRNQRVVIRQRGTRQEVILQGLRASDIMGHWVRFTITTMPISNYNGTGMQKNGETEDWFMPILPPEEPPIPPPPGVPTTGQPIPDNGGNGANAGAGNAPAQQGGGFPFGGLGADAQKELKKKF